MVRLISFLISILGVYLLAYNIEDISLFPLLYKLFLINSFAFLSITANDAIKAHRKRLEILNMMDGVNTLEN